ncbi:MAG: TonB-dependent receptor [Caulobacteraceae bacterium]
MLVCAPYTAGNIDAENEKVSYSGFKSKFGVQYKPTETSMLYFLYSQGFRPGGFSRNSKDVALDANKVAQFKTPLAYSPDTLTNYEIGAKTQLFDRRLQLNLSAYWMQWDKAPDRPLPTLLPGQHHLPAQRPQLRHQGLRGAVRRPGVPGRHPAGLADLQRQQPVQLALPDGQRAGRGQHRPVHHLGQRQALRQPVRRGGRRLGLLAQAAGQHPRPLRVDGVGLQRLRDPGGHLHRQDVHPAGQLHARHHAERKSRCRTPPTCATSCRPTPPPTARSASAVTTGPSRSTARTCSTPRRSPTPARPSSSKWKCPCARAWWA